MAFMVMYGKHYGETQIDAFLAAHFERVTKIYQDSEVEVRFNVVGSQQVDLSGIGASDWMVQLRLALMNTPVTNPAYTPYIEAVEELRSTHGADIVVYWRMLDDGAPAVSGAGSIGGGADEAYVVLSHRMMRPISAAHELGHLLGGQHGDGVQLVTGVMINGGAVAAREIRTVMTSATNLGFGDALRVWRFSGANATLQGDVNCAWLLDNADTCTLVPPAIRLGDVDHDTVSNLRAMAPIVAAFRGAPRHATPTPSPSPSPTPSPTADCNGEPETSRCWGVRKYWGADRPAT